MVLSAETNIPFKIPITLDLLMPLTLCRTSIRCCLARGSMTWKTTVLFAFALLVACRHGATSQTTVTAPPLTNQVVAYLDGAELQAETEGQVREILRALEDMRTLAPSALKAQRYAGYGLEPGVWTLRQLLSSYFVPHDITTPLDETSIYQDAQDPKARAVVSQHMQAIKAESFRRPSYPNN